MSTFRKLLPVLPPKQFIRTNLSHTYPGFATTMTNSSGNTLLAVLNYNTTVGTGVYTIADTQGNNWSTGYNGINSIASTSANITFAMTQNTKPGSNTITFTKISGTVGDASITVMEYSGKLTLDKYIFVSNFSSSGSVGVVNTNDTDMVVAFWGSEATSFLPYTGLLNGMSPTTSNVDTNHYDAQYTWTNNGHGLPPGKYTQISYNKAGIPINGIALFVGSFK